MTNDNTVQFLSKVLPENGLKILAELNPYIDKHTGETKQGWRYKTFDSVDAMAKAVAQFDAAGRTVYHACNGYGDWYEDPSTGKKRLRTGTNVKACRSLFDDIDIGKEGCYATIKEAMAAVRAFVSEVGLPAPLVVYSGGGVHLYWTLTEDITPEHWLRLSAMKRQITSHFGLKVDRAVDMDSARVLRPVGSTNHKYDSKPTVVAKNNPEPTTPERLEQIMADYITATGMAMTNPDSNGQSRTKNVFSAATEYPDSYADVIAEHCATVRWFKETGAPSEPIWHKLGGVIKHCFNGEDYVHAWSSKYEGYEYGETQAKLDNWKHGPATCEVIKTLEGNKCSSCKQNCKSPIQLGHVVVTQPEPNTLEANEIARLASLDPIAYDRERAKAAEKLGTRVTTLDKMVEQQRAIVAVTVDESSDIVSDDQPCSDAVDGQQLAGNIEQRFRSHVVVRSVHECVALTLWVFMTYIVALLNILPILNIISPEKRCGKSTLLALLSKLVRKALTTSNISPAALFRVIEKAAPTLLIDEADTFVRPENEELRGIVNSGHTRESAFVIRVVGDDHDVKKFFVPPLNEQEAINAFLVQRSLNIDSLINKSRRSIDLLKEHRAALISAAVTGKIDVREVS